MELEDQVCGFGLAKELKELGVKQDSLWYWVQYFSEILLFDKTAAESHSNKTSAFTTAELGEMLDKNIMSGRLTLDEENAKEWCCLQFSIPEFEIWKDRIQFSDTEADARAKMVKLGLIKKGLK